MKNRNLLFSFSAVIFGVAVFVLTFAGIGNGDISEPSNDGGTSVKGALEYYSMLRTNQQTGSIAASDLIRAQQQSREVNESRDFDVNWEVSGPDNYGGRTRAIIYDNQDPQYNTLYAGGVAGGVWKSTTSGQVWNPVESDGVNIKVSCMAQASDGAIYVGSGESFVYSGDYKISQYNGFIGQGIFKSVDGDNFHLIASTEPQLLEGKEAAWAFVNELAVDPSSGRLYAAANHGLVFSDDGGDSWSYATTAEGELLDTVASDVKIGQNGIIVASVANWCYVSASGASNEFVNHSTRYEVNPDSIANADKLPMEGIARVEFAIAPSNNDIIYAMIAMVDKTGTPLVDELGMLEGIYITEDKGETWRVVGPGSSNEFNVLGSFYVDDGANIYYYLGHYNNTLLVYPDDPYKILAGGYHMWEGEKISESGYYKWRQKSAELSLTANIPHSHHVYAFKPSDPNTLVVGHDAGISRTEDGLESFTLINKNYTVSLFYSLAYTNKGLIFGGTQSNGVLYIDGVGNSPQTASKLIAGNGGYAEASMIFPECFIIAGEGVNVRRSDDKGENFALADFFINDIANEDAFFTPYLLWEDFNNEYSRDSVTFNAERNYTAGETIVINSDNHAYPFNYVLTEDLPSGDSIRVKDVVSSKFFVGTEEDIWMTLDVLDFTGAPEWWQIASIDGIPQSMAYSDDANYLFIGTQDGKLYRVANIALAYNQERADISEPTCIIATSMIYDFDGRIITSIAVDPNNSEHIVVTLGNYGNSDYVFCTENALDEMPSFTSIQGNLPYLPVYSSLIEMNSSDRIILGTEDGIYTTDNAMSGQWSKNQEGMGGVPIFMLRQQRLGQWPISNYGVIYAATHGRGIFETRDFVGFDDSEELKAVNGNTLAIYPNPASTSTMLKTRLENSSNVLVNVYDLQGRLVKSVSYGQIDAGDRELKLDLQDLQAATYIVHMYAGSDIRMNKITVTH